MTSPAITVENEMLPLTAVESVDLTLAKRHQVRPLWLVVLEKLAIFVSVVAVVMSFAGLIFDKCSCDLLWAYVSIYCTSLFLFVLTSATPR